MEDTGRGIPFDENTDGVPNWKYLFLKMFAGTKYGNKEGTVNTGTNGVGNTVINYTSSVFEVATVHDGQKSVIKFKDGAKDISKIKSNKAPKGSHGTVFTFKLDDDMYSSTKFDSEAVKNIVKHYAVSSSKIKFVFKTDNQLIEQYHYNGIQERFIELVENTQTSKLATNTEKVNKKVKDSKLGTTVNEVNDYSVVLSTTTEIKQETYLNNSYLEDGGSINDGIINGVRNFLNKYIKDNNMRANQFSKEDIEKSISFVGKVESNRVEYTNQTKLSTKKILYRNQVKQVTNTAMNNLSDNSIRKMVNHVSEVQKANSRFSNAQKKLKKKLEQGVNGLGNRIDKLTDCRKHGKDSELTICEGLSASGSIIQARNANYQAVYPLRGKILNVIKASSKEVLSNDVIIDLIRAIGTGIDAKGFGKEFQNFDIKKARFGKIMIATDADADGLQIAALIITMFYKLMRPMLEQGRIYIIQTPLYIVKLPDDSVIYYHSEQEKEKNIVKIKGKYTISRLKGLGEVPADVMRETAMDKDTRNCVKVTVESASQLAKQVEIWLGNKTDGRKQQITSELKNYLNEIA